MSRQLVVHAPPDSYGEVLARCLRSRSDQRAIAPITRSGSSPMTRPRAHRSRQLRSD